MKNSISVMNFALFASLIIIALFGILVVECSRICIGSSMLIAGGLPDGLVLP